MPKKIAIIGATGMLGKPVTKAFCNSGYSVSVLVRDLVKAKGVLPQNIHFVEGDLRSLADLKRLLKDNDSLYLNLNVKQYEKPTDFHAEEQGLANILQVAKECGTKRIGFISSLVMNYQGTNGFNWWVFALKHQAVGLIKESGIPYTIFYPSTFMDNFHSTYRQGKRLLLAGESKGKMHFIAGEDFARQVVQSFDILTTENKEYAIQGLEAYTADEATSIFQQSYTKEKLSISKAPLSLLRFLSIFSQKMNYGVHIIEALNNYPEKFEAKQTWDELGKPTITLRDFAQW